MDVFSALFAFNCFLLTCADVGGRVSDVQSKEPNEEETLGIELFPSTPTHGGETRMPRTLFKKLHSKAAFLTGLKLGAILSKKGFELGHGKIASAHSFQIFGKPVNSAMSLSYGSPGSLLPLVDDEPQTEGGASAIKRTSFKEDDENVFRVTVIQNPSNETVEVLEASLAEGKRTPQENDAIVLYQDASEEERKRELDTNFIVEHNKRVKEFNEGLLKRRNSKF